MEKGGNGSSNYCHYTSKFTKIPIKTLFTSKKIEKKYNPITQFARIQIRKYYLKQVLLRFICGL